MTLKTKRPPPRSKRLGAERSTKPSAAAEKFLSSPKGVRALQRVEDAKRAQLGLEPLDRKPKSAKASRKAGRGLTRAEKLELDRRMGIERPRGVLNSLCRISFGAPLDEPAKRTSGERGTERRTERRPSAKRTPSHMSEADKRRLDEKMGLATRADASSPTRVVLGGSKMRKNGASK